MKRSRVPRKNTDWLRRHRPQKLVYPNEPPVATEVPFPPKLVRTHLEEFLAISDSEPGKSFGDHYSPKNWFEDANSFYYMDFAEGSSQLVLAQDKHLYYAEHHRMYNYFFDLTRLRFDGRFIFGQEHPSTIRFGRYTDNNLGRIFRLTEPKDAEHMLVSWHELTGAYEWLNGAVGVSYFYHDRDFNLYVVIPIGGRFDDINDHVIAYQSRVLEDRRFYQRLFEEKLKNFVGINIKPTVFEVKIPEPTAEELALKAQQETELAERQAKIDQTMAETSQLLSEYLKPVLEEFNLTFTLSREKGHRLLASFEEGMFMLYAPNGTPIYDYPISLSTFENLSPEAIAGDISRPTQQFLDRSREKFHAYRKLYEANLSYHNLVDPHSLRPQLDYNQIFNQSRIFKPTTEF